jgi:hypothetical protein
MCVFQLHQLDLNESNRGALAAWCIDRCNSFSSRSATSPVKFSKVPTKQSHRTNDSKSQSVSRQTDTVPFPHFYPVWQSYTHTGPAVLSDRTTTQKRWDATLRVGPKVKQIFDPSYPDAFPRSGIFRIPSQLLKAQLLFCWETTESLCVGVQGVLPWVWAGLVRLGLRMTGFGGSGHSK